MRVEVRCDGDDRIGAGHVSRCLRISSALELRGVRCELVGHFEGAARDLLAGSGLASRPPVRASQLGVSGEADALLVDSYEVNSSEIAAAALERPVGALVDGGHAPPGVTVLSYHVDAETRLSGCPGLLGPDYAPIAPQYAAARRARSDRRVLVTVGGGTVGTPALEAVVETLAAEPRLELFIASRERPKASPEGVAFGWEPGGLHERIAWADLAVSGSGSTPYELACAGVPSLILALAGNQVRVADGFAAAGMAVALTGRMPPDSDSVAGAFDAVRATASELAAAGPAVIDGYGAFRVADGLLAGFRGEEPPVPLRYRPATRADAGLLLGWRNDPPVRSTSRSEALIPEDQHARWLSRTLEDPDRTLLIVEQRGEPVATVRFDRRGEEAEVSVTVAPERRGGGIGSRSIREASQLELASRPTIRRLIAEVRGHNPASQAAFERAGYVAAGIEAPSGSVLLAYSFG